MPFPVAAVVVAHQREAHRRGGALLAEVADEHQVSQRLRHLGAVVADHPAVHPVAHERLAGGGLALGQLALVVGEDQVAAAAVDVDSGAEQPHRHGAALDVPAGPARPERRVPHRLVGQRRLPQHEVERVALAGVVGGAAPLGGQGHHGVVVVAAEAAVVGPGGNVEPGGALDRVGVAPGVEPLDEVDHLGHPLGGAGLGCGGPGVEVLHVAVEAGCLGCGQLQEVHSELAGLGQDRVVDIGDVAHHAHRVAEVLQAADQQVVGEVGVGVPEVGAVIGSDAAHVDAHLRGRRDRLEGHHSPPRGVVQTHGSEATADPTTALTAGTGGGCGRSPAVRRWDGRRTGGRGGRARSGCRCRWWACSGCSGCSCPRGRCRPATG